MNLLIIFCSSPGRASRRYCPETRRNRAPIPGAPRIDTIFPPGGPEEVCSQSDRLGGTEGSNLSPSSGESAPIHNGDLDRRYPRWQHTEGRHPLRRARSRRPSNPREAVVRSKPAICLISLSLTVPKLVTSGPGAPAAPASKLLSTICLASPTWRGELAVVPWRGPRATGVRSVETGGAVGVGCGLVGRRLLIYRRAFTRQVLELMLTPLAYAGAWVASSSASVSAGGEARASAVILRGQFADCCCVGSDRAWRSRPTKPSVQSSVGVDSPPTRRCSFASCCCAVV